MSTTMTTTREPAADLKIAIEGEPRPVSYRCDDYSSGCCACRFCAPRAWEAKDAAVDARNLATAEHRAHVATLCRALECLVLVGRAVAAALAPGLAVASFLRGAADATEREDGTLKGLRFRVTGKQGPRAREHHGREGICRFSYVDQQGDRYGRNARQVVVIGIDVGAAKLAYVPIGQCTRVRWTAADLAEQVQRAHEKMVDELLAPLKPRARAVVPARSGRRKSKRNLPVVYVLRGELAGKAVRVFWTGPDKRTGEADARFGVYYDVVARDGKVTEAVGWVSAYDCSNEPAVEVVDEFAVEVAADAAMTQTEEGLARAREILARTRIAV